MWQIFVADVSGSVLRGVLPDELRTDGWYGLIKQKKKAVPLRAWTGPECSRKLRLPDFVTPIQDGGRLSALRTGRIYLPGNTPGTHFC